MRLRVNPLKAIAFTPVSVVHSAACLVMDMNDLGLGHVGDAISLSQRPLGPGQVFQPGQSLIVGVRSPGGISHRRVGIVAKRMRLAEVRSIPDTSAGKPAVPGNTLKPARAACRRLEQPVYH